MISLRHCFQTNKGIRFLIPVLHHAQSADEHENTAIKEEFFKNNNRRYQSVLQLFIAHSSINYINCKVYVHFVCCLVNLFRLMFDRNKTPLHNI